MQTIETPTDTTTARLTPAQQKLVEDNQKLVSKAMQYTKVLPRFKADAMSVGYRALCEAAIKFDAEHHTEGYEEGKNSVFSSYAIRGIQMAIWTEVRKERRRQHADTIDSISGSDFESVADANEAKDERVEDKTAGAEMWKMLDLLPANHAAAVKGQMNGKTTRELAEELGVSNASVAIWQRRGLEKLRELVLDKESE